MKVLVGMCGSGWNCSVHCDYISRLNLSPFGLGLSSIKKVCP